jgi:hypothetical protein
MRRELCCTEGTQNCGVSQPGLSGGPGDVEEGHAGKLGKAYRTSSDNGFEERSKMVHRHPNVQSFGFDAERTAPVAITVLV